MITKYDGYYWRNAETFEGRGRTVALIRRNDGRLLGWLEPYRGGHKKGFWLTVSNTPPFFQREDGVVVINYTQRCSAKLGAKMKIIRVFERTEDEATRFKLDKRGQIPSHWRHRHVRASGSEQVENERGTFSGETWE